MKTPSANSPTTISSRPEPAAWVLLALLLFQSVMFGIAAMRLLLIWDTGWMLHLPWWGDVLPVSQTLGGIAAALAVLALVTAPFSLRLNPSVWLNAVIVQGITLLTLLLLYFNRYTEHLAGQEFYRYVFYFVMAYAVFMVFFLQLVMRRIAFCAPPNGREALPR